MACLLLPIIYLAFISLGLPDSLLGAAWPSMYPALGVPLSWAGGISTIISVGTVISALASDRLTGALGTGKVTALSVAMTAAALLGFSCSTAYWQLCLWGIPYGLGAGSVDAALNNYVSLHYKSRHMSWLHCMWGVGASLGPYIMGAVLTRGLGWHTGYRLIGGIQLLLTVIIFLSLPLWKKQVKGSDAAPEVCARPLSLQQILQIPGVKQVLVMFFCYCALEQTAGLWASSYLVLYRGIAPETAAGFASLFYIGITAGRALCGFLTLRFNDAQMIRMGLCGIAVGIAALLLPLGQAATLVGLIVVGLGCAPVYPSVIHATPEYFGADRSQAIIGVQMASAYVGNCVMPPLFGFLANHTTVAIYPFYLLTLLLLMAAMHKKLLQTKTV